MAISNQTVKALYVGDGAEDTFAIPADFIPTQASAQIKVYLVDKITGVMTLQTEGGGADYILDPPYDPVTNVSGPDNVIMNVAPANTKLVLVARVLELKQIISYVSNSAFPAKSHEAALDRIVMMVQQISDKLASVPYINIIDEGNVNPAFPPVEPDKVLVSNATGDGFVWLSPEDFIALVDDGAGVPVGGGIGALLGKLSATDGDAAWLQFAYSGFSSRYGQTVNFANLKEFLDYHIAITYTPPTISLSGSSNVLRERGNAVTALTLTAAIVKKADPIATVRFYDGATLLTTQTSGGAIPAGGNSTYNWTGSFSTNRTFSAQVDDNGATGGPTTVSSSTTYSFVYPYYNGVGAAALGAGVAALTKQIIGDQSSITINFTVNGSQKMYIAYPAAYADLTSILDVNGFNTLPSWTKTTTNITGLDGNAVSYKIYEFNNFAVAATYAYTFVG